jgi:ArsR family transcriptional regulator
MKKSAQSSTTSTSAELEQLFQALGDQTRLRLLNLMSDGEVCVCFFVEVLSEPQPKISRHLAYLRSAGLVRTSRDGKWISYSIAMPEHPVARRTLESVLTAMKDDREMQRDRTALARACCSPRAPEQLQRAPRPASQREAAPANR